MQPGLLLRASGTARAQQQRQSLGSQRMLKSCRATLKPVPVCHYQAHHWGFKTVFNQDLTSTVRAGAVFSLSPAEQLPVTVQGETTVTGVTKTLYCSYTQACRARLALTSACPIKLLWDRTAAVIPEQSPSTHREAFCAHIFSCHILMSPAFSQHTDTKQGQDSLTTFPILPGSPWLRGFHSWLQLSAVLSAHIIQETNTKQVMLEALSQFCQPFPNNNS